ncbi:MAG TPA: ribose-5-phosphate isomerase RpiA [Acidobacteriaceae bacterium]
MQDETKRVAARRSMEFIEDGMRLGIGSGTTVRYVIEMLGERVRDGLKVIGVPTSAASAELAAHHGIELATFEEIQELDLAIDGADEIGPRLSLIKGGGGALLHEKIVASAAKRFLIVVGEGKVVEKLGRFPLPVEVVPFAAALVQKRLSAMGGSPQLRPGPEGANYLTDEGNWILDCPFGLIEDPHQLAREIRAIVGVVEHGLFLDMATEAVVADAQGVSLLSR